MSGSLTDAMRARLEASGAVPRVRDLYQGTGTDFYERLVGPDRAEIREVLALARRTEGPILDLAAGSGRVTIPLVRSGNSVTAIDLSDDMLSHLRRALPAHPSVECIVADMRDFSLGRRFGLVIIGATSITVLDREGRSLLYANVRRHLADGGIFALTVAGGAAAAELAVSRELEITVPGPDGDEPYLFSQQIDEDGAERVVNWARVADLADGGEVTVVTSRLRVLSAEVLVRELTDAGFAEPDVEPVRTHRGDDILLLTTTEAGACSGEEDHASD